jgi:hypothetical protein
MTRVVCFALFAAGVLSSAARAAIDVAPPPREIRPDGSRDPAPGPPATKQENPLEVVERIIKNSKAVGDKLAMTDTGTDTQKTQTTILKDIDALLNRHEDPPPPKPDQNMDKNKDMQNMSDPKDKKDDAMPMGGMDPKDKKDKNDKKDAQQPKNDMGMGGGMDQQPMGGDQPKGHRPRQKMGDNQPKDPGMNQATGKPDPKPMGGMQPKDPPKNPGGQVPDPSMGDPKNPVRPALPFEDDVVKSVWGHLPDKLRQQATQYYRQEFMPRYAELLKHYYSSLSEKGGKK